jgi:hypothetical protein
MAAKSGSRSEQLRADQLRLFAQELGMDLLQSAEAEKEEDSEKPPAAGDVVTAMRVRAASDASCHRI